jgi:2-oxo-3-hexenedioate decarboxylase
MQSAVTEIAAEALQVLGTGHQVDPFSRRFPEVGLKESYRVTAELRRLREARGEQVVGRKIGFTNRTIWREYGVFAPIWGYVYDTTIHDLAMAGENFSLKGFAEPRIEPEIIFGLASAPSAGMDERQLLGCIEWVAHGFEIVQSIFPGWRFIAPDTVAAYGLHGALLVGSHHREIAQWEHDLTSFEIDLHLNGELIDHGRAANVLNGPLFALRHLVDVLASDRFNPSLAAGEIVTTGTLTRAFPVTPGQRWHTQLKGIALPGAKLSFG